MMYWEISTLRSQEAKMLVPPLPLINSITLDKPLHLLKSTILASYWRKLDWVHDGPFQLEHYLVPITFSII